MSCVLAFSKPSFFPCICYTMPGDPATPACKSRARGDTFRRSRGKYLPSVTTSNPNDDINSGDDSQPHISHRGEGVVAIQTIVSHAYIATVEAI